MRAKAISQTSIRHRVPTLVIKIRSDLKEALRERDKARSVPMAIHSWIWPFFGLGADDWSSHSLSVIRGILAQIDELEKVERPIKTDAQLYAILKTRFNLSKDAAAGFADAKRYDLEEYEKAQAAVVGGYLDTLVLATDEEVLKISLKIMTELESAGVKPRMGKIISRLLTTLDGKPVEMDQVSRIVREMVASYQKWRI